MEIHPDETVVIYTDGSRLANPARGGFAAGLIWTDADGHEGEFWHSPPGYLAATVPQMELKAAIEGVRLLLRSPPIVPRDLYRKVRIYADATYIVNNHSAAKFAWRTNGWMTSDGPPVENAPMWKEFLRLESRLGMKLEICKVEGHGPNPHNAKADHLARASAEAAVNPPLEPARVRRKQTSKRLRRGTVPMEGQILKIHIHKGEFMRVHRVNQFEFSIKEGPHEGEVVLAYADPKIPMREGHSYLVQVNKNTKNPAIVEMLEEIPN